MKDFLHTWGTTIARVAAASSARLISAKLESVRLGVGLVTAKLESVRLEVGLVTAKLESVKLEVGLVRGGFSSGWV